MTGVFFIDQAAVQQVSFINRFGGLLRIDSRTRHATRDTLASTHCRTMDTVLTFAIHACRIMTGSSRTFFEPIQFHLQLADLAIQPLGLTLRIWGWRPPLAFKQRFGLLLNPLLPLSYLG
jgi:hypothetical protein